MSRVQTELEPIEQIQIAQLFATFTSLDGAKVFSPPSEQLHEGDQRVRTFSLADGRPSSASSSNTTGASGVREFAADGVPESFAVKGTTPDFRDKRRATAAVQGIGEVIEGGDARGVTQGRVSRGREHVVINPSPAVVSSEEVHDVITPGKK
jgi:hypothetical protein